MIKTVKIDIHASDPNLPLARSCVFAGSAASFTILNVPRAVGSREITGVSLIAKNVAGTTLTKAAVRVGSAWEVTIPASHFATVGTVANGIRIAASGLDENETSASWVLGIGNLAVLDPTGTVSPSPSTKSEIYKEDFADVASLSNATLNQVSAKVNQILAILKPALLALVLMPAALAAALLPTTPFGDVPPTNTIAEVVAAGGGSGGGVDTNAVKDIAASATVTNLGAVAVTTAATNALATSSNAKFLTKLDPNEVGEIKWEKNSSESYDIHLSEADLKVDAVNGIHLMDGNDEVLTIKSEGYSYIKADEILLNGGDEIGFYLEGNEFVFVNDNLDNSSNLLVDDSPVATSNMVNRIISNTYATVSSVASVSSTVSQWENYWSGDKVRLSVTNYYGNTSGELPRLRIEESQTNTQGVVTNWVTVWDEESRHTNYMTQTDAKVNAISNTVLTSAFQQTATQLAGKAPRAWQSVTSAGEAAPEDTVWLTAPTTVFAGGTEYAHVTVGEGTICVLVDNGAPVYTEGEEGKFHFYDETRQYYFGFDVRSSYTLGCRTDGISVDETTHMVSLTYDLTSSDNPVVLHSTNLVDWATQSVTWEANPPAGSKICYIDVGTSPKGFYKSEIQYAGGAKFITNMQADLTAGIAATNEALNVIQNVYPVITSTGVVWRVKN